tara:strand:- start:404 stop:1210 length:807 start_codon:yes stop_codon:yes gene_type:complete
MKTRFKSNTLALVALALTSIAFTACEDDEDETLIETRIVEQATPRYQATITMKEKVNGADLTMNTTNKPYSNLRGQTFNVSRLRYLISDVTFHKEDGTAFTINDYHFVDATDPAHDTYMPTAKVPAGTYNKLSFTFGFDMEDNISFAYSDLNLANWEWPAMLGGGYHFMQLEGEYDSSGTSVFFAAHMGTARNNTVTPTTFEANHFEAVIDTTITVAADFSFALVMNIEQWFEGPYEWDFNVYNASLMPVYDAQRKLNLNGPSVFTYE